ncbi:MAG: RHS repeat protein [Pirellulales bacterium]|nr:RHS repeat protein [Pirellulales bacterium]
MTGQVLAWNKEYQFDRFAGVTEYTDELGHRTTYERNADGLVTKITTADPAPGPQRGPLIVQFLYDARPGHRMNLVRVQSVGGAQSFLEEWHYEDEFNLVVRHLDKGARHTVYLRDAAGNVREVRRAIGNLDNVNLPAVDDLTTSYTYTSSGAAGLLDTRTDPDGRVTDVDYLGATGLVSAITFGAGSAVAGTRQFFYDAETRVMTHSLDELGRRTDYVYDALDRLTEWWEPDPDPTAHGDADRPVWVYDYCACGRLTSVLDPEYTITSYRFHPQRGWLSEAKILGSDLQTYRQEFYGYDATGRLTSVTTGLGQETSYLYDDAGRLS